MASSSAQVANDLESADLGRAFRSFTEAAGSLERSYGRLQVELARLRRELQQVNRDLASSLTENQRMRAHLDRILETLPCGVVVLGEDGHVSLANPEAGRYLPAESGTSLPEWADQLLRQLPADCSELEYRTLSGESHWIAINRSRMKEAERTSLIFILEDISARKRLAQAQETLRRREALAQMSALLAHEIRNPLGSMELFAGLLSQSRLSTEQQDWTEHLQAGIRRLGTTVNNVLHLHSESHSCLTTVALGEVLHSFVSFIQPLAKQANVTVELADRLAGAKIPADRHRLEQVFLNLAMNAFRAMEHGGTLHISALFQPNQDWNVSIEIADTGAGIPQENLSGIFEAGFTTRAGSPGLGLAVVKAIVAQHGGRLDVNSVVGQGTTFRLQFRGGFQ